MLSLWPTVIVAVTCGHTGGTFCAKCTGSLWDSRSLETMIWMLDVMIEAITQLVDSIHDDLAPRLTLSNYCFTVLDYHRLPNVHKALFDFQHFNLLSSTAFLSMVWSSLNWRACLHCELIWTSMWVAEHSTNAADAVRVICMAGLSLFADKGKPHNSHLFSDDPSIIQGFSNGRSEGKSSPPTL